MNLNDIPTPCYVIDMGKLQGNLEILAEVKKRTGCKILLALKGFAMYSTFPLIRKYLDGACASSLDESRLAREEMGGEVHAFAPAYKESEFTDLCCYVDHVIFNSFPQWIRYKEFVENYMKQFDRKLICGIRVNPEYSEVKVPLYDPCYKNSRLGATLKEFKKYADNDGLVGISGLHFHTMCEQNSDTLERTLRVFEEKFGPYLDDLDWINFGGGHHISRADYDVDLLCVLVSSFRKKYGIEVYLEPGEAIALNAGVLVASVLDIVHNEIDIAILDTSATAHMPDVLEMPYRPDVVGAGGSEKHSHTYRLAGPSCLAGDVIGDYSFREPLKSGDKIVFKDMAHYTMVKNNTFNGMRLPAIAKYFPDADRIEIVKSFDYFDFRNRLS